MAALGVVKVIEVDAHKSMTFRDAVACEVAKGLVNEVKENILGTLIFRNRSGDTMRVSQFMFSNGMSVEILLGRHSTFLLEGGLLGNHDKENKDVGMLDEDGGLQDKNTSNGRATRQVHEVTNDGNPNKAGLESIMKEVPTSYANKLSHTSLTKANLWKLDANVPNDTDFDI
ncbi:hypothetical protein Tco_0428546 [Tanacetum coccineum]